MTTNYEEESYVKYVFWLSGETSNLSFYVKPSIIVGIMREFSGKTPYWCWFQTKEGLACVDTSKITAIYPEQS